MVKFSVKNQLTAKIIFLSWLCEITYLYGRYLMLMETKMAFIKTVLWAKKYLIIALLVGLYLVGWIFWNVFIVAESSVGFTNRGGSGVSIYKITLDEKAIYDGPPKYHGPNIKPSEHAHFFNFFKPRGKLHMIVYFIDNKKEKFTALYELDHRTGRCEFYCGIDNQHTLNCVCDDVFDFGH